MRPWYAVGMMLEVERTNVQGHSVELVGVIEDEMSVMTWYLERERGSCIDEFLRETTWFENLHILFFYGLFGDSLH